MSKLRNKRLYIVLALLLCIASVSASFALFSSWKTATNNLSVGHNEIEVVEEFDPPPKLEKDTTFQKIVKVKNTGNVPCYVRVFADFSDSEIRDIAKFSADGDNFVSVDKYQDNLPEGWVYDKGTSYYYYMSPVQPDEETPALFHSVQVVFPSEQSVREFQVIVSADSIQTAGADGAEIDNYKTAWETFLSKH